MDAQQLRELATNAELNHWPAHLGVTTDAEKVEYLAARLREVATEHANELEAAGQREESLNEDVIDLTNKVDRLESEVAEFKHKLKQVKEIVS
jgi:phage shock protein A